MMEVSTRSFCVSSELLPGWTLTECLPCALPVLTESLSGCGTEWKAEEAKDNSLIFFPPVKLSGFLLFFLKLCETATSVEFIAFPELSMELPSADLELSENDPGAQIKTVSCLDCGFWKPLGNFFAM